MTFSAQNTLYRASKCYVAVFKIDINDKVENIRFWEISKNQHYNK